MHVDAIKSLIRQITDLLEDLWVERAAYRLALRKSGWTDEQLNEAHTAARSDPELRQQARQAYAQMRNALLDEASPAVIEALTEEFPPSGQAD